MFNVLGEEPQRPHKATKEEQNFVATYPPTMILISKSPAWDSKYYSTASSVHVYN